MVIGIIRRQREEVMLNRHSNIIDFSSPGTPVMKNHGFLPLIVRPDICPHVKDIRTIPGDNDLLKIPGAVMSEECIQLNEGVSSRRQCRPGHVAVKVDI